MLSLLWQFFKTGPDIAQIADSEVVKRKFNSVRWRVFASITIGYAFYYIIRQSYSVIKKPLLADGNRYYRFYLLRHVRLREIYQQLPRRPNEQQAVLLLRSFHFIAYDGRHGPGKLLRTPGSIVGPQRLVPVLRRRPVYRRIEPMVQQQTARNLVRRMVYEP